jgi:two-component system response regulator YesN
MHSVLIVDDEEPVLDGYEHMVETCVEGFTLAGKARSGYEALALLHKLRPQVVFMDIGLPGMDGLATIEEVHGGLPDTVFVVSTAYERFDLARRAIPLGIFRYLVKPVTKKDFTETLEAVKDLLEKRQASPAIAPCRNRTQDLADHFLKVDLWGPLGEDRWQTIRSGLGLESHHGRVVFVGADVDQDRLFGVLSVQLAYRYLHLFTVHRGMGLFFVPGDAADGELEQEFGRLLAAQVPAETVTFVGVGSNRSGTELPLSCQEALAKVNAHRDRTDLKLRERIRVLQLRRKLGLAPLDEVQDEFRAYWQEIFGVYDFAVAKSKMVALFSLLIDDGTGETPEVVPAPGVSPAEDITPLVDAAAWARWSGPALEVVHRWAAQSRLGGLPGPLVKALAFVDEHFDRPLQLSDAAEAACVSPAYLSRLFSDHMDSTFVGYLTVLRMEKAEKLVREHRLNIKEVAFRVGYQDPNYFSKIFRKVVGISPSLYARGDRHEK